MSASQLTIAPLIESRAEFSPCRAWRYLLLRRWHHTGALLRAICLNPSTADETRDDPTVRRLQGYAYRWGFSGLLLANIFAFRSTDPRTLYRHQDPVGPGNDDAIRKLGALKTHSPYVLCAWGNHGKLGDRSGIIPALLGCPLAVLGLTKTLEPKHPLYLRGDALPTPWAP